MPLVTANTGSSHLNTGRLRKIHVSFGAMMQMQSSGRTRRGSPGPLSNSVAIVADTDAYARCAEADSSAALFVVTPALDVTLARSVSVGITGFTDDDPALIALAPATAVFIADHANVLNVAPRSD
jgi:hypothetical protein